MQPGSFRLRSVMSTRPAMTKSRSSALNSSIPLTTSMAPPGIGDVLFLTRRQILPWGALIVETKDTFFIGGEWVAPASTQRIEVTSPFTEHVFASVPEGTEADMDRAVAAARETFDSGALTSLEPKARADLIRSLSAGINARSQELADCITAEVGSPSSWSLIGQVLSATMVLDAFAELVETFPFEETRAGLMGPTLVRRESVGVSASINPI